MRKRLAAAITLLVATACSDPEESTPDAGVVVIEDAGVNKDAEPEDSNDPPEAGFPDATSPPDAEDLCAMQPQKPRPPLNVINGTRQPTLVPLDPAQIAAVVGLSSTTSGAWCSGTLIAERTVLTANHCTYGEDELWVLFGEDDYVPDLAVPVVSKLEHPMRDTALLTLAFDPATQLMVRPIPIFGGTLTSTYAGITVEQAGYGDTQSPEYGRFFVTERLTVLDYYTFTVDGMGEQGVCFGDSGGPSLMIGPDGDARVIGELSQGDEMCAHRDDYVRIDLLRPWIEDVTGPTPGAGPIPCRTIGEEGECRSFNTAVSYCENGALISTDCGAGEVCGWNGNAWRCVASPMDPCGGLGLFGACEANIARWCDRGELRERDCTACDEQCLYLGERTGFDCDPDPSSCGDLDIFGWCNGDVSEWCEEGVRQAVDCAAKGQVCRFIDWELGWYCVDR